MGQKVQSFIGFGPTFISARQEVKDKYAAWKEFRGVQKGNIIIQSATITYIRQSDRKVQCEIFCTYQVKDKN